MQTSISLFTGWFELARAHESTLRTLKIENPGDLAQPAEHLACNEKVIGSTPIVSIFARLTQLEEWLPYKEMVVGSSPTLGN